MKYAIEIALNRIIPKEIKSIIAAKVVDFPLPVGPVTRTSPRGSKANLCKTSGKFNSSNVLICSLMIRIAAVI